MPVPTLDVVQSLMGFKNHQGEFVQRRAGRAIKQFRDEGWMNLDDLTIAAIHRTHEEQKS